MSFYRTLGTIPSKRHTQFEKPDGQGLYYEQLFGTVGFDGMSSLLYHIHRPTMVRDVLDSVEMTPKLAVERNMLVRKMIGFDVQPADDFLESRTPLLVSTPTGK